MNKAVKEKLPHPFYFKSNIHLNDYQLAQIIRFLKYYKVIKFNLYKGKLEVKIFSAFTNPAKITADLEDQFSYLL